MVRRYVELKIEKSIENRNHLAPRGWAVILKEFLTAYFMKNGTDHKAV